MTLSSGWWPLSIKENYYHQCLASSFGWTYYYIIIWLRNFDGRGQTPSYAKCPFSSLGAAVAVGRWCFANDQLELLCRHNQQQRHQRVQETLSAIVLCSSSSSSFSSSSHPDIIGALSSPGSSLQIGGGWDGRRNGFIMSRGKLTELLNKKFHHRGTLFIFWHRLGVVITNEKRPSLIESPHLSLLDQDWKQQTS